MPDKSIRSYQDVDGWFGWQDRALFSVLLEAQGDQPGVLVELGAYLGRSAVVIGDHVRDGERFVVVDLFGSEDELTDDAGDPANRIENRASYSTLTRERFEQNYLALHPQLPQIVQGLSTEVLEHVEPGSARFVHVDASHLYLQVATDIQNVHTIMRPDGVVVFDDIRAEHTPGVAAAVWAAIANDGLVPFLTTRRKLYATWGDPAPYLAAARAWITGKKELRLHSQEVAGHTLLVCVTTPAAGSGRDVRAGAMDTKDVDRLATALVERMRPELTDVVPSAASRRPATPRPTAARSRAADWLPPVVARAVQARRRA